MMSSNVSPNTRASNVSGSKEKTPQPASSGKPPKNRRKSATTTSFATASSPVVPTQSSLTPDHPRTRSSSIQFPARDSKTSLNAEWERPEETEDNNIEPETPTKKPGQRARLKSTESTDRGGPSSLVQTPGQAIVAFHNQSEIPSVRPTLMSSHTSPESHKRTRSGSQRPNIYERSASEPATPAENKKLSGLQLDGKIAHLINTGPTKKKKRDPGSIYFFRVKPRNCDVTLMKIGRTQQDTSNRLNQIQGVCEHMEIDWHAKAVAQDIPFHGFAEDLIHMELRNYKYPWPTPCVCGTKKHHEYFQVSQDIAVRVFERWRDFCQEKPWDDNGKILRTWARRLQNRAKLSGSEALDFDHHEFAKLWDAFTHPSSLERFLSDAILVWELGFPNRWQIICLAELLTIVCISRHSLWTSTWTTIIIFFLLLDLVVTDNMHTTTRISQFMEGGLQSSLIQHTPPRDKSVADSPEEVRSDSSPESTPRPQNNEEMPSESGDASTKPNENGVETGQVPDNEVNTPSRTFTPSCDSSDEDSEAPTESEDQNMYQ
jgi:hypothetical protein